MNHQFWGIVLAAGKGTRMKSDLPKVLHQIAGKPILYYPIKALLDNGAQGVVVVVGHGAEDVVRFLNDAFPGRIEIAIQKEQKGTGHAVQCGLGAITDKNSSVVVLYGDMPLVEPGAVAALLEDESSKFSLSLLSTLSTEPFGYGRMIRSKAGSIVEVREERDCNPEEATINEINPEFILRLLRFLAVHLQTLKATMLKVSYC
ncbi:MAG: NTP transferase domain-containing protein [Myxococcales bacterium]|nr:MAG: NTP transferase domain-containing protein [Myxococcales bacterium]